MLSKSEEAYALMLKDSGLPAPVREFKFLPDRKYRFDFAWPSQAIVGAPGWRLAVEIEGLTAQGGRHQRKDGFVNDAEKYRLALEQCWMVHRIPSTTLVKGASLLWPQVEIDLLLDLFL